jgi:hypothetical protein
VWDLVNTAESYSHLLDVLADHLTRPYQKRTREGIARALAVREAKGTGIPRVLMEELKKETDPNEGPNSYRWALINTLVFIGDSSLPSRAVTTSATTHSLSVVVLLTRSFSAAD